MSTIIFVHLSYLMINIKYHPEWWILAFGFDVEFGRERPVSNGRTLHRRAKSGVLSCHGFQSYSCAFGSLHNRFIPECAGKCP